MEFTKDYNEILQRIENINPVKYAKTRNFIDGDVTYLSPYISRGVISTKQIADKMLQRYKPYEIQKFLQELAWREYWQRIWQHKGKLIFTDLKNEQQKCYHYKMPKAIVDANTGIDALNVGIETLYENGYMHNHLRMYTASVACNVAGAHWLKPAQWMYYHLLDGDLASNMLSWQWVAGTNSAKKYYCNQENISYYTHSNQKKSYLSNSYEMIVDMPVPEILEETAALTLHTNLPEKNSLVLDDSLPLCIYNSYNLDVAWHAQEKCNRILLLEPSHFTEYPVSEKVISFITTLAKNIEGIQIFTGEFDELKQQYAGSKIFFKKHPAFLNYKGIAEEYYWMFSEANQLYPSFFAFWKKCEKQLT
jgi:deoxyribodipyrimidine photo-lyase